MRMRRTEGFTLIELMIVVAIIGILAAIAIPNFLKFQCKSKQSEAKTNLSGIFTGEKAFFGEYNSYGTDLVSVNWFPDGTPLYLYGYNGTTYPGAGFTAVIAGYDGLRNNTAHTGVVGPAGSQRYSTVKMTDLLSAALTDAMLPATNLTGQIFLAAAVGDVDTDPGASAVLDKWTINENKQLLVVAGYNDCSN